MLDADMLNILATAKAQFDKGLARLALRVLESVRRPAMLCSDSVRPPAKASKPVTLQDRLASSCFVPGVPC